MNFIRLLRSAPDGEGERACDERDLGGCCSGKGEGTEEVLVGWPVRISKVEDVDEGCISAAGFSVMDIVLLVD